MNCKAGKLASQLLLAVALALFLTQASADFTVDKKTIKLDPFSSVQNCVPFNVLILPVPPGSPVGNYALYIEAETAVLQATSASVSNGTLQLQLLKTVSTQLPVKITVYLPGSELKSVASTSGIGQLTVGPGFSTSALNVYSAFGTGNVNVFNLTATSVNIASSGTGQVFVNGTISTVYAAAGGTAGIIVLGLNRSAMVNLAGASNAVFGFTNTSGVITGVTTGSNSVTSNVASCSVQTAFLFGAPCLTQTPLTVPTINPAWSCGINVTGSLRCPAGGIAAAASSASVGVAFSSALPAFLAPAASTPASAIPPTIATGGQAVAATPATATDAAVQSQSPSGTTVINVGSGFRSATASGPGSQSAIAVSGNNAAAQQAALNNLVAGRKLLNDRKLQQSGNAALDALLAQLQAQGGSTSISSSSTSNTPGTFTSSTGPGSLACAYANGQGGCQGGLLGANNLVSSSSSSSSSGSPSTQTTTSTTPTATTASTDLTSLINGLGSTGSSSSNVVSSSSGNGPSTTTTFTSGPGASATGCTSVNGVSNCQQSVNGSPPVKIAGTTFFDTGLPPVSAPPSPLFPTTGSRIVATTTVSGASGTPTSITGGTCSLPSGSSLNIFGS